MSDKRNKKRKGARRKTPAKNVARIELPENVTALASANVREKLRLLEALLFAAEEPLDEETIAKHLAEGEDVAALLEELKSAYAGRGINLVKVARRWAFRTADDLAPALKQYAVQQKKLSRAALETLAIIAYHQPVTRAEIEEVRGVTTSKGTLDVLLQTKWVRPRGRRKAPGRPLTYGTSDAFLEHFGFETIGDLPGLKELKEAGLLEGRLPPDFSVPKPDDAHTLRDDEEAIEIGVEQDELPLDGDSDE